MRDLKCHLRDANSTDSIFIEKWLRNPEDCRMAIGHAPLNDHDFGAWLNAQDQMCLILESPVGSIAYGEIWVDDDVQDLELAHLVVSPDHRNRGYGKLLTQLLFERGKQYGYPSLFMRIYPENTAALKCYTSAGFIRVTDLRPDMPSEWVWLSKSYED